MAITPEECLQLTDNEKHQIEDLEKIIDAALREKFDDSFSTVEMTLTIPSSRIYNQILSLYRSHGWEIISKGVGTKGEKNLAFKKKSPTSGVYAER